MILIFLAYRCDESKQKPGRKGRDGRIEKRFIDKGIIEKSGRVCGHLQCTSFWGRRGDSPGGFGTATPGHGVSETKGKTGNTDGRCEDAFQKRGHRHRHDTGRKSGRDMQYHAGP